MKRFLALALTLVMALSLTACGGKTAEKAPAADAPASSGADDGYLISVILKTSSSEYWQYIIAGAEAYEKDHPNVTVEIKGPPSETSYDEQQNMIETDMNNADIDGYVIAPLQSDVAANLIAGETRPVFALDTNISAPEIVSFIGTGNEEAAKQGAALAVQAAKDAGWETIECIEIAGVQGDATNTARMNGYTAGVEENGGDFLEAEVQYANAVADQATTCMEAVMQTHPDGVAIICANNDDMASAAARAASGAAGWEKTIFLGFDGSTGACQAILDGQMTMSIAQQPYEMGYKACEAAYKTLMGETVDQFIDSGIEVITPENAQARIDTVNSYLGK